jgi:hypothetical protein
MSVSDRVARRARVERKPGLWGSLDTSDLAEKVLDDGAWCWPAPATNSSASSPSSPRSVPDLRPPPSSWPEAERLVLFEAVLPIDQLVDTDSLDHRRFIAYAQVGALGETCLA